LTPKNKEIGPHYSAADNSDIGRLYRDCSVLNYFFQDWIRTWFPSGIRSDDFEFCNPKAAYRDAFKIRVANCFPDIVRGPMKAPNRVISKVVQQGASRVERNNIKSNLEQLLLPLCRHSILRTSKYQILMINICKAQITALARRSMMFKLRPFSKLSTLALQLPSGRRAAVTRHTAVLSRSVLGTHREI
jgi:hypothetical protein